MKWINVKDRLPEIKKNENHPWRSSELVFIYDPNLEDAKIGYLELDKWQKDEKYIWQEHYGTSCDHCAREKINPVAWMPLPERPEKKHTKEINNDKMD